MKRTKRSGMSFVEIMLVVAFMFIITGFVANAFVQAMRIQNVTGAQADMQRETHHQVDTMMYDVHYSQLVLANYTYNNVTYNSNNNNTLVLQAHSYDASGNTLATDDIMIYTLRGASAPYQLCRTVIPAAGSARAAEINQLLVANVLSMTLTYYADDSITGDGVTKAFTLSGNATSTPTVIENGATLTAGQLTFTSPNLVTFTTAPTAPASVDIVYPVDPSVSPSQVSTIDVDLKAQQVSTAFQTAEQTQTVDIASRSALRNH